MKRKLPKLEHLAVLLGISTVALAGTPNVAHAVGSSDPYAMIFIVDAAYGNKMHHGNYGDAISKLTTGRRSRDDDFEKQTNLCVAYTKERDLGNAEVACAAAVRHAEERVLASGSRNPFDFSEVAARRDAAIALSNLGVVRAVSGDRAGALQNFQGALELDARIPHTEENLARLMEQEPKTD